MACTTSANPHEFFRLVGAPLLFAPKQPNVGNGGALVLAREKYQTDSLQHPQPFAAPVGIEATLAIGPGAICPR